jgi:hypothetical protein
MPRTKRRVLRTASNLPCLVGEGIVDLELVGGPGIWETTPDKRTRRLKILASGTEPAEYQKSLVCLFELTWMN